MGKVKIEVTYCGGWGYGGKYEQLKRALLAKFADKIEISGKSTPTTTGYFEVQIVGGPLVWSKKECNKFPSQQTDLDKIFAEVAKLLEAPEEPAKQ